MRLPHFNFLLLLVGGLLFLSSCDTLRKSTTAELGAEEVATFILVRHSEKQYGADPELTPDGQERAERISFMLKNTDISAVYSTDTKRTQLTAAPTAKAKDLEVQSYDPFQLELFAKELKRKHKGETVLVVGHSNTTPSMANFLSETENYPRFSELDYTNFYVVTVPSIGAPRVLKLRF